MGGVISSNRNGKEQSSGTAQRQLRRRSKIKKQKKNSTKQQHVNNAKEGKKNNAPHQQAHNINSQTSRRETRAMDKHQRTCKHRKNPAATVSRKRKTFTQLTAVTDRGRLKKKRKQCVDGRSHCLQPGPCENAKRPRKLLIFPYALRCQPLPFGVPPRCFFWNSAPYVPFQVERDLLPLFGDSDGCLMKKQDEAQLLEKVEEVSISLQAALSLRQLILRHHRGMVKWHLPVVAHHPPTVFEQACHKWLKRHKIAVWSQEEQHAAACGKRMPPTPDFVLKEPILMRRGGTRNNPDGKKKVEIWEEYLIHWIEVKMFYGASTTNEEDPNGHAGRNKILRTCRKYVKHGGPGAFVFLYGCGEELAIAMAKTGVLALDCMFNKVGLDLTELETYHRRLCANRYAEVLL